MTDTATPMPEAPQRDPGTLTEEQQRRVRALGFARDTLHTRPNIFGGSNVEGWSVEDLLAVADWILDSNEPEIRCDPDNPIPCPPFETVNLDGSPAFADEPKDFTDLPPTGALHENDPEPGPGWPPVDHLADGVDPEPATGEDDEPEGEDELRAASMPWAPGDAESVPLPRKPWEPGV